MSSLPELSVFTQASGPTDSPCRTESAEHSAAGEWCRGRSTKTPTNAGAAFWLIQCVGVGHLVFSGGLMCPV